MADSPLHTALAEVNRAVADGLGELIPALLFRRSEAKSDVTGERGFDDPVPVDIRVAGSSLRLIQSNKTTDTAKHRVTLYNVRVAEGDKLTWGGEDHIVLVVRGLVANTNGDRYQAEAVTN